MDLLIHLFYSVGLEMPHLSLLMLCIQIFYCYLSHSIFTHIWNPNCQHSTQNVTGILLILLINEWINPKLSLIYPLLTFPISSYCNYKPLIPCSGPMESLEVCQAHNAFSWLCALVYAVSSKMLSLFLWCPFKIQFELNTLAKPFLVDSVILLRTSEQSYIALW